MNHINIIDLIHQYRFDAPSITGQLIIKAQKSIASDAFCHFIKKLSIKKFKYHITNDNNVLFIAKLISFLFITKKLEQHKLKTNQSSECKHICADYLKIIFNNETLLKSFIKDFTTTTKIELNHKLFLLNHAFKVILPSDIHQSIVDQISATYWKDNQLVNKTKFYGHSERNELLFSTIAPPHISHLVMKNYTEKVNTMGQYYNPKSLSTLF